MKKFNIEGLADILGNLILTLESRLEGKEQNLVNGVEEIYVNGNVLTREIVYLVNYNGKKAVCYNNPLPFKKIKMNIDNLLKNNTKFEILNVESIEDLKSKIDRSRCGMMDVDLLWAKLKDGKESVNKEEERKKSIDKARGAIEDKTLTKYSNLKSDNDKILYVIKHKNIVAICCDNQFDFEEYKNVVKIQENIDEGFLYIEGNNKYAIEGEIRKLELGEINEESLRRCLELKGFEKCTDKGKDTSNEKEYEEFYMNADMSSEKVFYFGKGNRMVVLDTDQEENRDFERLNGEDISKYPCVSFNEMYAAEETKSYVGICEGLKGLGDREKKEYFVNKIAELLEIQSICEDVSIKKVKYIFHNGDKYIYIDDKGKYNNEPLPKLNEKSLERIYVKQVADYIELCWILIDSKIVNRDEGNFRSNLSKVLELKPNVEGKERNLNKIVAKIKRGEIHVMSCGGKAIYISSTGNCIDDLCETDKRYIYDKLKGGIKINNYADYYNKAYKKGIVKACEEEKVLASLELDLNLKVIEKIEGCKIYAQKGISLDAKNKFTKGKGQYVLVVKKGTNFSKLGRNIEEWKAEELDYNKKRIINLATREEESNINFKNNVKYDELDENEKQKLEDMMKFMIIPAKEIKINQDNIFAIKDNFEIIQEGGSTIEDFNMDQLQLDKGHCLDLDNIAESEEKIRERAKESFKNNKLKNYNIIINSDQKKSIESNCDSNRWGEIRKKNKINIKDDIGLLRNIEKIVIESEKDGKEVVIQMNAVENNCEKTMTEGTINEIKSKILLQFLKVKVDDDLKEIVKEIEKMAKEVSGKKDEAKERV